MNASASGRYLSLIEATLRDALERRIESAIDIDHIDGFAIEWALPALATRLGMPCSQALRDASVIGLERASTATRFFDGAGHSRPIYLSIVAATLHSRSILGTVAMIHGAAISALADRTLTLTARCGSEASAAALAARAMGSYAALQRIAADQQADGTFLARTDSDAPEPRWYDELAILHALSSATRMHDDPTLRSAVTRAVRYHAAETQPDHASSQPWALAAFLAEPEAIPLADMMLHAAGVQSPRTMDAVSLFLLADALECGR